MLEVSAIFTRVVMKGSVPGGMSKSADNVLGFFSMRIAIASVLGIALSIVIGTTAPFSAMSGAVIWICALSDDPLPPSAFSVAATVLVSNAALFHCCWAKARPGRTRPASASIPAPPPAFNILRRLFSTRTPRRLQSQILPWDRRAQLLRRLLVVGVFSPQSGELRELPRPHRHHERSAVAKRWIERTVLLDESVEFLCHSADAPLQLLVGLGRQPSLHHHPELARAEKRVSEEVLLDL